MPPMDNRSQVLAARLISAAIIVLGLYVARPVLIPLGLALLLAFMLQPAVRRLRRLGLPNALAVGLTATVVFALLGMLVYIIAGQVQSLVERLPDYRKEVVEKVMNVRGSLRGGSFERLKSTVTEVMQEVAEKERAESAAPETVEPAEAAEAPPVAEAGPGQTSDPPSAKIIVAESGSAMKDFSSMAGLLSPLATAGLVVLLVVILLLKWADLRARLIALVDENLTSTTAALDDAARRVSRYLAMQFMVNVATGLAVWGGLSLIGLEWAGLMGLCAGILRYVPYVGPVVGAGLPLALSVATMNGWGPVIAVAAFFVVLELVLNNVVEPWLYGSRVGVSELGIIMAAVVWTLLWGPVGLVLATPLTVCLVVLGENVPGLAFFSKLLSDRAHLPEYATLTQRLIAGDTIEAADILSRHSDRASVAETYDAVVVPALARVRHEQRLGHLDAGAAATIASALPPVFADLASDEEEDEEKTAPSLISDAVLAVWSLCPMTEAAVSMLPHRLRHLHCTFLFFNTQTLASDAVARLKEAPPLAIALLHLDPTDFPRATATLRRLRRVLPDLPLIVGRWGEYPLTPAELQELDSLGAAATVASPADLAAWAGPRAISLARVLTAPEAQANVRGI